MKVVLPGGSGHVGALLCRAFQAEKQHEVVVLSRRPADAPWRVVAWDGATIGAWADELDGADVVINLAGRSVDCRYTPANRREIVESRIRSTSIVGDVIGQARRPPRVWLQASTATIYAHRYDAANDEATGVLGGREPGAPDTWRFSNDVARIWENVFDKATTSRTRKVAMRSAIIMSADHGSAFDILLRLVRFGLGGPSGDGRQFVSWIHGDDFVCAVRWLIDHEMSGVVNVASPNPVPNAEFMRALRDAWGIGIGLPSPAWLLEIGAWLIRTESELVLKSRRVVPGRLVEAGFTFRWPDWTAGARDLVDQWKQRL